MATHGLRFEDLVIPPKHFAEFTWEFTDDPWSKLSFGEYAITKQGGNSMAPKVVDHTTLKAGDTINVRYEGEVVSGVSIEKGITFIETASGKYTYAANNGHPAKFELVKAAIPEPANWPPKKDDVWEATDAYGTVVYYHTKKNLNLVRLDTETSYTSSAKEVLEAFNGSVVLRFRPGLNVCSVV